MAVAIELGLLEQEEEQQAEQQGREQRLRRRLGRERLGQYVEQRGREQHARRQAHQVVHDPRQHASVSAATTTPRAGRRGRWRERSRRASRRGPPRRRRRQRGSRVEIGSQHGRRARRWERHSRKVRTRRCSRCCRDNRACSLLRPRAAPSRAGPASSRRSTWARTASGSRSARSARPLSPHRLPQGNGSPRRRPRRRRLPQRRGGDARPRLPGPLRAPARRLPAAPGARGSDADAARSEEPRRFPAARADRPRPPDRDHLRARGGAPDLRRRRAAAALDRAAPGDRHRRPLDRDDPRPRHAAAPGRVVPDRQRQPVDEVLPRRAASASAASARPRSPPAPSSRRHSRRSRRATGRKPSARRAPSARSRRCSPPAASATAASRRPACAG